MDGLTKFRESLRKYLLEEKHNDSTIYSPFTRPTSSTRMSWPGRSEQDILWENMGVLHLAIQDNDINVVKEFIKGSDWPKLQGHDPHGRTLLHWAMAFGNNEVARLILMNPATSKRVVNFHDKSGRTALHYAAMAGRNDLAKILFMKGTKINGKDRQGLTPLHYAAQNANPFLVHTLLARGADKFIRDKSRRLPYHVALAWKSSPDIVQALDPDVPNDELRQEFMRRSTESGPTPISYYDQDLTKDTMLMRLPSYLSRLFGRKPKSPFNVAKIPLRLLGVLSQRSEQRCSRRPMPNPGEQLGEAVKLEMEKDARKAQTALLRKFHVGSLERYKVMNAVNPAEAEMRQSALEALVMRHNRRVHERKMARKKERARLRKIDMNRFRIPRSQPNESKVPLKMIRLGENAREQQQYIKDYNSEILLNQLDRLNQETGEEPVSPISDNTGKFQNQGLKRKHQYNKFAQDDIEIRYASYANGNQREAPASSPSKKQLRRLNQFRPQGVNFSHYRTDRTRRDPRRDGYDSDSSPSLRTKRYKAWETRSKAPYERSDAGLSSNQSSHDRSPVRRAVNFRTPSPAQRQGPRFVARPIRSAGGEGGFSPTSTRDRDRGRTLNSPQMYSEQQNSFPVYQRVWKEITSQYQRAWKASSPPRYQQQSWQGRPPPSYEQATIFNSPPLTTYRHNRSRNAQNAYYSPSRSPFDNNYSQQSQMAANHNVRLSSPSDQRQRLNSDRLFQPSYRSPGPFRRQLQPSSEPPPQSHPPYNTKRGKFQNQYGGPVTPYSTNKIYPRYYNPQEHSRGDHDFPNGRRTPFQFQAAGEPFPWRNSPTPRQRPLGLVDWATRAFPNLVGKNKLVPSLGKPGPWSSSATTRGNDRGYYGIRDRRKKKKVRKKFKYYFLRNTKRPVDPKRRALTEFVGTADRCNYVNTPKIRVHQCLDLEKLHKQWL